jgi:hypothetical protein
MGKTEFTFGTRQGIGTSPQRATSQVARKKEEEKKKEVLELKPQRRKE